MICSATASIAEREASAPDLLRFRSDFPILQQTVHGRPLVYFDNAATTQKPQAVIEAVSRYYSEDSANVHRGIHALSERATAAYEGARIKVQQFLNAADSREIVCVLQYRGRDRYLPCRHGTSPGGVWLMGRKPGWGTIASQQTLIRGIDHGSSKPPLLSVDSHYGGCRRLIAVVIPRLFPQAGI